MTYIKICGIRSEADALGAAKAGADFIGLVFAPSPRRVTPKLAGKITAALKENKAKAKTVGVFVNENPLIVNSIAVVCRLGMVQLSGDESWAYCRELALPIIKVFRLNDGNSAESLFLHLNNIKSMKRPTIMLDAALPGKYGGTGMIFNWELARPITKKYPVIIAGGLNPENVGEAIKTLKPWGVDVSSGVETNGVKDMTKVIKFITAVREADASQA